MSCFALRMGLPAEMVDQVFRMVPPEYTAQMKAGLAAASAGGRGLGQRLVAAVPPQLVEKITPVLKEANHTILAVALQATEVWNELVKQYSH